MDIRTELAMEVWRDNLEKDERPEMPQNSICVGCKHCYHTSVSASAYEYTLTEEVYFCDMLKEFIEDYDASEELCEGNACVEYEEG